ncbi:hypothetical protein Clacol_008785 [Clathrus columnatus]|uniref:Uncharacterized protein n=1 Tax=Clathrus columnatus TaxID=1419009 RepID=A0AAV5AIP6_9AGAM|nr:hypothetical protein Clacol_008785 [Clathrus columnatus]
MTLGLCGIPILPLLYWFLLQHRLPYGDDNVPDAASRALERTVSFKHPFYFVSTLRPTITTIIPPNPSAAATVITSGFISFADSIEDESPWDASSAPEQKDVLQQHFELGFQNTISVTKSAVIDEDDAETHAPYAASQQTSSYKARHWRFSIEGRPTLLLNTAPSSPIFRFNVTCIISTA